MSDVDPELPDYLVDAILSQGPPSEAVDLVKNAFTWRTVDAELMELSYDSVLDTAGVRDATARRTIEFTIGETSVVVELEGGLVRGQVTGGEATGVTAYSLTADYPAVIDASGSFLFESLPPGPVSLELSGPGGSVRTPAFTLG